MVSGLTVILQNIFCFEMEIAKYAFVCTYEKSRNTFKICTNTQEDVIFSHFDLSYTTSPKAKGNTFKSQLISFQTFDKYSSLCQAFFFHRLEKKFSFIFSVWRWLQGANFVLYRRLCQNEARKPHVILRRPMWLPNQSSRPQSRFERNTIGGRENQWCGQGRGVVL